MSATEAVPVPVAATVDAPRSRRHRRVATTSVIVLVCALLVAWWFITTLRLEEGGFGGVSSADHEVVWATGLDENVYVVSADGPGLTTVGFGVVNTGPVPVEIVDIWPSEDSPLCSWRPIERSFQDDPQRMGVLDDQARPAQGAILAAGAQATVWLTGSMPDPAACEHSGGINTHDDVEVVARVFGRTSSARVPLTYTFGYSDDPQVLQDYYDVRVLPPTEIRDDG